MLRRLEKTIKTIGKTGHNTCPTVEMCLKYFSTGLIKSGKSFKNLKQNILLMQICDAILHQFTRKNSVI